jgi:hypothetical protein
MTIDKYLDLLHPSEIMETREAKKKITDGYIELLSRRKWSSFITLTFEDFIYPDIAHKKFDKLLMVLNKDGFGKHYTNYVGHSYFSYALATEYQKRDVLHYHLIVDRPINYELVHRFWESIAGYAKTQPIHNYDHAIKYISKYVTKGGDIEPFFAKKIFTPLIIPIWWIEENNPDNQGIDETINL